MKRLYVCLYVLIALTSGCDTPWAAAKRQREGITWDEWRHGIRTREQKEQKEAAAQEREAKMLREYFAAYPNLDPEIVRAVKEHRIIRGMNETQVMYSWGFPSKINKSTGAYGQFDQWIYRSRDSYLYFENGILDSWQNF